jgi:hypothetical protein
MDNQPKKEPESQKPEKNSLQAKNIEIYPISNTNELKSIRN